MRYWLVFLLGCAALGCANGDASNGPDSGEDVTIGDGHPPPPDSTFPDQEQFDQGQPDTGFDTGPSDAGVDSAKPDGGADSGSDGPSADADAGMPPMDAACGVVGKPCDFDAQNCPIFFICNLAFADGGPDGGPDGVCMAALDFPFPCNDGKDHCAKSVMCLNAQHQCLTAKETTCICGNPETAAACGPP